MIPVKLTLSDKDRSMMPGTPISFSRLGLFPKQHLQEYTRLQLLAVSEATSAGKVPTETGSEAWVQEDGSLLVVVPGLPDSRYTMTVPAGEWSDLGYEIEPAMAKRVAQTMADRAAKDDEMVDAVRQTLKAAEEGHAAVAERMRAYEEEFSSALIVFDKTADSLLSLWQLEASSPTTSPFLTKWRADTLMQYLIVLHTPESMRPYVATSKGDVTSRVFRDVHALVRGQIGKVGIGSPSLADDVREILAAWQNFGGGRPFE